MPSRKKQFANSVRQTRDSRTLNSLPQGTGSLLDSSADPSFKIMRSSGPWLSEMRGQSSPPLPSPIELCGTIDHSLEMMKTHCNTWNILPPYYSEPLYIFFFPRCHPILSPPWNPIGRTPVTQYQSITVDEKKILDKNFLFWEAQLLSYDIPNVGQ